MADGTHSPESHFLTGQSTDCRTKLEQGAPIESGICRIQRVINMNIEQAGSGKARRILGDIVMGELFLIQATIESATAIGSGLSTLGKQFGSSNDDAETSETFGSIIQRTADEAVEPYITRFKYLRQLMSTDS
ncbi:MAG: hypothetical protein ACJAYC_001975 [Halieaceae bacterium]|jgi:hypothetical protein